MIVFRQQMCRRIGGEVMRWQTHAWHAPTSQPREGRCFPFQFAESITGRNQRKQSPDAEKYVKLFSWIDIAGVPRGKISNNWGFGYILRSTLGETCSRKTSEWQCFFYDFLQNTCERSKCGFQEWNCGCVYEKVLTQRDLRGEDGLKNERTIFTFLHGQLFFFFFAWLCLINVAICPTGRSLFILQRIAAGIERRRFGSTFNSAVRGSSFSFSPQGINYRRDAEPWRQCVWWSGSELRQRHLDEKTRDAISPATGTECSGNEVIKAEKCKVGGKKKKKAKSWWIWRGKSFSSIRKTDICRKGASLGV